ncbi:MAG: hypothetical protein WBP16_10105 [Ferruginibacter sp.]
MDYCKGIYDALRNGKPLPVKAQERLNVSSVIEVAFKSVEKQRIYN